MGSGEQRRGNEGGGKHVCEDERGKLCVVGERVWPPWVWDAGVAVWGQGLGMSWDTSNFSQID